MSIRSRAKKRHDSHSERWLVSYADFMTLLFAFFVVMYAIAMEDKAKAKALTDALKKAFQERGFSSEAKQNPMNKENASEGLNQSDCENSKNSNNKNKIQNELNDFSNLISDSLKYELHDDPLSQKIQLADDSRGLVVRLSATDFFELGQANAKPEAFKVLFQIGKLLSKITRPIRIEGHTDNLPVHGTVYPSNWELSAARSSWVIRFFIEKFSLNPSQLSAAGYGEYKPLADNDSEEGRSKNRRIEIVLLKDDST